ncbi:MAG: hypothetical protein QG629_703 [Patescibacteria group bacterium]|nr:hypothetical protein [Patescibacteria group bacterium]
MKSHEVICSELASQSAQSSENQQSSMRFGLMAAGLSLTAALVIAPTGASEATGALGGQDGMMSTQAGSQEASSIRVLTYNVLGSNFPGTAAMIHGGSVVDRANRSTDLIKNQIDADVLGVQELQPDQYRMFAARLPGYKRYPTTANYMSDTTIFWKENRFRLKDTGSVAYPTYEDRGLKSGKHSPWVKLEDNKTGKVFFVVNNHPVAWNKASGSDEGGALKRERAAHIIHGWAVAKFRKSGKAVLAIGDFNSAFVIRSENSGKFDVVKDDAYNGNRYRLPYCIITKSVLANAYDLALPSKRLPDNGLDNKFHCPSELGKNDGSPTVHPNRKAPLMRIDHIYATPSKVSILKFDRNLSEKAAHASDHWPTFVDFAIK